MISKETEIIYHEKKKIKINFVGYWDGFVFEEDLIYNILKEQFDVEISDHPDYIIASSLGKPFEYLKYDCVRILYTGEPLVPDFNVFDYAIGFDYLSLIDKNGYDRYYRYPFCFYFLDQMRKYSKGLSYNDAVDALKKKKYFCNFLYSHPSARGEREQIFRLLESYKRVESAGSFMNNMPDKQIIPLSQKKMEFLKECKFTIACESASYPGFVTEKLVQPFFSQSIPIYYGNSFVNNEFNSKAFINLHEYRSFDDALDRIREIDSNDDLYIKMLMEPKLITDDYFEKKYDELKCFLIHIFSQEKDCAFRRMRCFTQQHHEDYMNEYRLMSQKKSYRLYKKTKRVFRS